MRGTTSVVGYEYDYLLSAAATSCGQSFRRRQQRLPKRQHKQ